MKHFHFAPKQLLVPLGCIAAILLTAACYWPSLSGPFIFDDFPNLAPIGEFGGIHSWETFKHYVFSGNAGPLGRPISLASFVLNAQDWPASPYPFKVTNLALHLINGALLYILATQLLSGLHGKTQARKMALVAMSVWLLHPLLVSTTAFVVQRMTQLSGMFVLLGLIGYLHGRTLLDSKPRQAWLWIIGSISSGGALAILSKETGVLLPLFALSIEMSVFSRNKEAPRKGLLWLLCLPVFMLLAYIASLLPGIENTYLARDFTLTERLLTQSRILLDYLSHTLYPQMRGSGIYHDDYPISAGILSPLTTLFSLLTLCALLASACAFRKKFPLFALAVFWFLAGHFLESNIIPLELYYEHRNYLPIMGIAILAGKASFPSQGDLKKIAPFLALLFILFESFITWQNASMWSSQAKLVHFTLLEHPTSLRALERAALYSAANKDYRKTLSYLQEATRHHPSKHSLKLSIIQTKCLLNELNKTEIKQAALQVSQGAYEKESILYLPEFIHLATIKACDGLDFDATHQILDAIAAQAARPGPGASKYAIHYQRGMLFAAEGRKNEAMAAMDTAYSLRAVIDVPLLQTIWMISVRNYKLAQKYLDTARHLNQQRARQEVSREADIEGFQGLIDQGHSNPNYAPFEYPLRMKDPI